MTANTELIMSSILILGAGRSSSSLISYLLKFGADNSVGVTVGDVSLQAAQEKTLGFPGGRAIAFDINNKEASLEAMQGATVVISLMPAHLHAAVGKLCLQTGSHLLTASYVSDEMKRFDKESRDKSLLFLNECGLDPGIDHMSAMQVMERIRSEEGKITSFESFTGGLIASETDINNPWRYKFTWNSRNVVMAGQGTAKFLQDGKYTFIPYQRLFKTITQVVVPGYGEYEGYANRDSLKYLKTYGLNEVRTMLRGTLRNKGFCSAWDVFVQLGCCEDTYELERVDEMTHASFMKSFVDSKKNESLQATVARVCDASEEDMRRLEWSGLFTDEPVGLSKGTPAQVLEHILNKKWKLHSDDKDMIVMWHRFGYLKNGVARNLEATLIAKGSNSVDTAMAKTVGLPLAIVAKLLIQGKIGQHGVVIPTSKEIYDPVLRELSSLGVELKEWES